ncbi:unnamed protein product [Prunus armeniaca]|uniref:Uncharacterized protein n=1 Tax=Prunus armeniaca TaxID=36596 RepID=A0A6J5VX69_PRUAR|nr:unnamed protein product [Prunus armeniaca]
MEGNRGDQDAYKGPTNTCMTNHRDEVHKVNPSFEKFIDKGPPIVDVVEDSSAGFGPRNMVVSRKYVKKNASTILDLRYSNMKNGKMVSVSGMETSMSGMSVGGKRKLGELGKS